MSPDENFYPQVNCNNFPADWVTEQIKWTDLNANLPNNLQGNPKFFPLTIKAFYVLSTVYLIKKNVEWLNSYPERSETYISRFLLTATCVELLGRCVKGNETPWSKVDDGWDWLLENGQVTTKDGKTYTSGDLSYMRHFSAHGQATTKEGKTSERFKSEDEDLLDKLWELIIIELDNYWVELVDKNNQNLCENLAKASIEPISASRLLTIYIELAREPHRPISKIFEDIS